ncbi:Mycobacterial pentapeptide repeat protein [Moelleriella libera RCEF 2490]|uniref:Mycobacterial pentapeptide repeat protein n=1 Tax=Moelleriella libera RCEF 2490 TaxID=1081109 RepID=A0A166PQ92_9HYPO|nr:Mycobacterial pentapeptide repeat protein [Moelleriella libera RCEF 2490]
MEDPWMSQRTVDSPVPVKIDLASEPQQAQVGRSLHETTKPSSLWDIDSDRNDHEAWSGWTGATTGRDAIDSSSSPRSSSVQKPWTPLASPGPWKLVGEAHVENVNTSADSAISLGEVGPCEASRGDSQIPEAKWEHYDLCVDSKEQYNSASVDLPFTVNNSPAPASRHPSKVRELVDMYDVLARSTYRHPAFDTISEENIGEENIGEGNIGEGNIGEGNIGEENIGEKACAQKLSAGLEGEHLADDDVLKGPLKVYKTHISGLPPEQDLGLVDDRACLDERSTNSHEQAPRSCRLTEISRAHSASDEARTSKDLPERCSEDSTLQQIPSNMAQPPFTIDLAGLNDLFPDVATSASAPEQFPATLVTDSFSNIAERKTWYRISRMGSMRRHNTGDHDGYVSVSWHDAQTRKDTLKVVRRWLETGSPGGHSVAGLRTGHAGASMFNWDSDAAPIKIGELLASTHPARPSFASVRESISSQMDSASTGGSTAETRPSLPVASTPIRPERELKPPIQIEALDNMEPVNVANLAKDEWLTVNPSRQSVQTPSTESRSEAMSTGTSPILSVGSIVLATSPMEKHHAEPRGFHTDLGSSIATPSTTANAAIRRLLSELPDLSYMLK